MMITGDYHYTAIAVARDVGIVRPQRQVVIIDINQQSELRSELSSRLSPFLAATTVTSPNFTRETPIAHPSHIAGDWDNADDLCHQPGLDQQHQDDSGGDGSTIAAIVEQASSATQTPPQHLAGQPETAPAAPLLLQEVAADLIMSSISASRQGHGALPPPSCAPGTSWEGLHFETDGHEAVDAQQAITALAEGHMQCAVTGDAFEYLLQHRDLSLLDMVMRSAVVFSRMQPGQKGQVMDLLSVRGMHQLFNGQTRFIPVVPSPLALQLCVLHICA